MITNDNMHSIALRDKLTQLSRCFLTTEQNYAQKHFYSNSSWRILSKVDFTLKNTNGMLYGSRE